MISRRLFLRSIIPPTSNTTIRGPLVLIASRSEPGPDASSVAMRITLPLIPPLVALPNAMLSGTIFWAVTLSIAQINEINSRANCDSLII